MSNVSNLRAPGTLRPTRTVIMSEGTIIAEGVSPQKASALARKLVNGDRFVYGLDFIVVNGDAEAARAANRVNNDRLKAIGVIWAS